MENKHPTLRSTTSSSTTSANNNNSLVSQTVLNDIYEAALTSICIEIASDMHRFAKTGVLPYSQLVIPKRKCKTSTSNTVVESSSSNTAVAAVLPAEQPSKVKDELEDSCDKTLFRRNEGDSYDDAVRPKSPEEPKDTTAIVDGSLVDTCNKSESFISSFLQVGDSTTTTTSSSNASLLSGTVQSTCTRMSDATAEEIPTGVLPLAGSNIRRRSFTTSSVGEEYATAATSALERHGVAAVSTSTPSARSSSYDIYGRIPPKEPKITSTICLLCGRSVSAIRFAPHLEKCMGLTASTSRNVRDI